MLHKQIYFDRSTRECARRSLVANTARLAAVLIAGLLIPTGSQAEVKIATETKQLSNASVPNQTRKGTIYLDGSKLRMEAGGKDSAFIFRGDKKMLWALDPANKSYVQLDEETVSTMGKRVDEARQQLEAHMQGMSEQEQEMMKKMMKGFAPGMQEEAATTPPASLRETSETKEIDGKKAKKVELMRGSERIAEVWLTDWKSAGVSQADFNALRELAAFQRRLMEGLGSTMGSIYVAEGFDVFDKLDGFPLLIRRYVDGKVDNETTFKTAAKVESDAKRFEIPDGYKRTKIAQGKSGGGKKKTQPKK